MTISAVANLHNPHLPHSRVRLSERKDNRGINIVDRNMFYSEKSSHRGVSNVPRSSADKAGWLRAFGVRG